MVTENDPAEPVLRELCRGGRPSTKSAFIRDTSQRGCLGSARGAAGAFRPLLELGLQLSAYFVEVPQSLALRVSSASQFPPTFVRELLVCCGYRGVQSPAHTRGVSQATGLLPPGCPSVQALLTLLSQVPLLLLRRRATHRQALLVLAVLCCLLLQSLQGDPLQAL